MEDQYICWRPDTKSKALHAACRQYIFDTTADLLKWLRSRRNSTELIIVGTVRNRNEISGRRCDLAQRTEWPLP